MKKFFFCSSFKNFWVGLGVVSLLAASQGDLALDMTIFESKTEVFSMTLSLDTLGVWFFFVLCCVVYSISWFMEWYMKSHMTSSMFCVVLFLFCLSMCLTIFSSNSLSLILGWDGLGLTSFLLVMSYSDGKSSSAAMSTVMSNRVGDCFFISGLSYLTPMWSLESDFQVDRLGVFLFVVASLTKSAQGPFSSWLTEAMEAPTPVSALVHSSTLITAGIYVMIRFFALVGEEDCFFMMVVGVMSSSSACYSSFFTFDSKKLVALSTLAQVSSMFFTLGVGCPSLAMNHLMTHAFSKAMTFIAVGAFISSFSTKTFNSNSNILSSSPIISISVLLGNLAMAGVPVMALGSSKDLLCNGFAVSEAPFFFCFFLSFFVLSSFYMVRKMIFISVLWKKLLYNPPVRSLPLKYSVSSFFVLFWGSTWLGPGLITSMNPVGSAFVFPKVTGVVVGLILVGLILGFESVNSKKKNNSVTLKSSFFFSFFDFALLHLPKNFLVGGSFKNLEGCWLVFVEGVLVGVRSLTSLSPSFLESTLGLCSLVLVGVMMSGV